jgi:hypothetical protein
MSRKADKRAARAAAHEDYIRRVPPELTQPDQGLLVEQVPGEHRWAVMATYLLSGDECLDAHRDDARVLLDVDHLANVAGPLCLICEQPWKQVHGQPCKGDPDPSWKPAAL